MFWLSGGGEEVDEQLVHPLRLIVMYLMRGVRQALEAPVVIPYGPASVSATRFRNQPAVHMLVAASTIASRMRG